MRPARTSDRAAASSPRAFPERRRPRLLLIGPLPNEGDAIGGTKVSFATLVRNFETSGAFETRVLDTARRVAGAGRLRRNWINLHALVRVLLCTAWNTRACDLILFNASSRALAWAGPWVWLVSRISARPMAVRVFGGDFDQFLSRSSAPVRALARRTYLRSPLVLLQTRALCQVLAHLSGLRWFPTTRGDRLPEVPRPRACRRFLFLSQLRPEKGLYEALEASDRLPPGCTLTLCGPLFPGVPRERLASHAYARVLDPLPPERVGELLAAHDALVFPTWYPGEGLPGVVIEALQSGLPVIASRWRSLPDLVTHGGNGLLVEPHDSAAVAGAMLALAADDELYQRLARTARTTGAAYLSPAWHARLEAWLAELCAMREPKVGSEHELRPAQRSVPHSAESYAHAHDHAGAHPVGPAAKPPNAHAGANAASSTRGGA